MMCTGLLFCSYVFQCFLQLDTVVSVTHCPCYQQNQIAVSCGRRDQHRTDCNATLQNIAVDAVAGFYEALFCANTARIPLQQHVALSRTHFVGSIAFSGPKITSTCCIYFSDNHASTPFAWQLNSHHFDCLSLSQGHFEHVLNRQVILLGC